MEQLGYRIAGRTSEKYLHQLVERAAPGGRARLGRKVYIAQPLFTMPHEAFGFQPDQHRANRRIAGRVGEPLPNILGGSTLFESEQGIHNFALAARKLFMWR